MCLDRGTLKFPAGGGRSQTSYTYIPPRAHFSQVEFYYANLELYYSLCRHLIGVSTEHESFPLTWDKPLSPYPCTSHVFIHHTHGTHWHRRPKWHTQFNGNAGRKNCTHSSLIRSTFHRIQFPWQQKMKQKQKPMECTQLKKWLCRHLK